MSDSANVSSGGVSFVGLLFIVFLVLKLTKVIAWSWWWVCSPLLVGPAILLLVIAFALPIYIIYKLCN